MIEGKESALNSHSHMEQEVYSKTVLGFWVYLMSDCILFSCLFAVFGVLHNNTYGGLPAGDIFSTYHALIETIVLLVSSFTCGLAVLAAHEGKKAKTLVWLFITFVLGVSFLTLELIEFSELIQSGNSFERSAFLSSFFTLVGTHGAHITVGLFWLSFLAVFIALRGFTAESLKRLACFSLFWHFLDVVWIFIFTFVYLMGAI